MTNTTETPPPIYTYFQFSVSERMHIRNYAERAIFYRQSVSPSRWLISQWVSHLIVSPVANAPPGRYKTR